MPIGQASDFPIHNLLEFSVEDLVENDQMSNSALLKFLCIYFQHNFGRVCDHVISQVPGRCKRRIGRTHREACRREGARLGPPWRENARATHRRRGGGRGGCGLLQMQMPSVGMGGWR